MTPKLNGRVKKLLKAVVGNLIKQLFLSFAETLNNPHCSTGDRQSVKKSNVLLLATNCLHTCECTYLHIQYTQHH